MPNSTLRIISRESPLAMWQAEFVRDSLNRMMPNVEITILGIKTEADKFLNSTLEKLGGKGAFVKELEQALLEGHADIAVHSMKDVVVHLPEGLAISAILERHRPGDAFVSNLCNRLEDLPPGSVVGTSSLRRQCQLKFNRPDLEIKSIRGNVGTRIRKLDEREFDALILASSGLYRLGLHDRIKEEISRDIMLPAIGQGALGIEVRADDQRVRGIVEALNDQDTYLCVQAERMVNMRLNGGCHAPIAAYASLQGESLTISALVGKTDGTEIITAETTGNAQQAMQLGDRLGQMLLDKGAGELLKEYRTTVKQ